MINIPKRSQQSIFAIPGPRALSGTFVFILLVVLFAYSIKNLSQLVFMGILLAMMTPIWVGAHFDRKARSRQLIQILEDHGLQSNEIHELDSDFLRAAQSMKPYSLKESTIKSAAAGVYKKHEMIITEHIVGRGRYKQFLMSCAIWTPHDWPKTIIRQRVLMDKIRSTQDLGIESFDKQREIISDDIEFITPILSQMIEWFYIEKLKPMTFQMMPPSGRAEQWIFDGNWIIHADRGRANPKTILQMAEFLTAFVEQIELSTPN